MGRRSGWSGSGEERGRRRGGGDEAAARRAGMEGARVTGDPRDRRRSESGGSTPERWGRGRGLGVERIWRGAGEAERRSAEPRRRRGGGARWAKNGGGR